MTDRRDRRDPPLWFTLVLVAGWAAIVHALDLHAREDGQVSGAFLGWLVVVAQAIWAGIQAFGQLTLVILGHTVSLLWEFAKRAYNGLLDFGRQFLKAGTKLWGFVRELYDQVLLPAWQKLWKLVDTVGDFLDRVFGPVLDVLKRIRTWVLDFYRDFVRPVLDTIDVIQKALGLLERLGVQWAGRLDAYLQQIEDWIDEKFRAALGKLNEAIDVIDRNFTKEGLLQRLTFVRTLARDMQYVGNLWWHTFHRPLTAAETKQQQEPWKRLEVADVLPPLVEYLESGGGPDRARIDEAAADLAIRLRNVA